MRKATRKGFTLIETVVTVGIVAAMAAVVIPQVAKQFDAADPTRVAEDLASLSTAIETFSVNVKPNQPQEIEDLINTIQANTAGDSTALGAVYSSSDVSNWNGPYLGVSILSTTARNDQVITTGFGATVNNRLPLYDVNAANGGDTTATSGASSAEFVSILITGLSGAAFNSINEAIDGPTENTATLRRHTGRLRCPGTASPTDASACSAAYFLASPLRQ